ncbi:MAG: tRNA preQ1(34) S-adenosylmethionine ribosyltransferase-isomerase QueA [Candidatus Marinimicrobia bacterium]|nr:tRNA preQ1(34) S-adenosylmethionine ribosyltransferase-isomerase QueA [Candidatus Neomarinimicrobiota bacterium]
MSSYNVNPILKGDKVKPEDFNYELPNKHIAQYPTEPRDSAKLMVMHQEEEKREHTVFSDILDYLEPDDVLVLNNTKVFPAKFVARKEDSQDPIDVFLLRELGHNTWEVSVDPARKVRIGNSLIFSDNIVCDVIDNTVSSGRVINFQENGTDVRSALEKIGEAPLPPYIKRKPEPKDKTKYQTIYAEEPGSVVAPSAGLHFTDSLLDRLQEKGVKIVKITLHLGLDSYEPITISDLSRYDLHSEYYNITIDSARTINDARDAGNRIIAVGASTARVLETSQFEGDKLVPREGWTDLFIFPPYHFQMIDGLISNFHQPQSATIILQQAFYNYDSIVEAYKEAIKADYNFLGFGDAMLFI